MSLLSSIFVKFYFSSRGKLFTEEIHNYNETNKCLQINDDKMKWIIVGLAMHSNLTITSLKFVINSMPPPLVV